MKIHKLDEAVIRRIAAGEVITRPSSALKELIENSIDAGAEGIVISILSPDILSFSVEDDGCGMTDDEILASIERYSTSKIKTEEDLLSIRTLGFRGEALNSIASISKMIVASSPDDRGFGFEFYFDAGMPVEKKMLGMKRGTRVAIYDLFYNTPVRRRFLKKGAGEYRDFIGVALRYVIANPDVNFSIIENRGDKEKELFRFRKGREIKDTISEIIGIETGNLFRFNRTDGNLSVEGILCLPEFSPSTGSSFYVYVNKRFIRDRIIISAVRKGMEGILESGRYPAGALFISMPPSEFDVNIHPQKLEVRFIEQDYVFRCIVNAVSDAVSSDKSKPFIASREGKVGMGPKEDKYQQDRISPPPSLATFSEGVSAYPKIAPFILDYRLLGSLWDEFTLIEKGDDMLIMDRQALSERIIYDRLQKELKDGRIEVQYLLTPCIMELTDDELSIVMEGEEIIKTMGFVFETFGKREIAIRGCPAMLRDEKPEQAMRIVISALSEYKSFEAEELFRNVLSRIACHSALRGSIRITDEEVHYLIQGIKDIEKGYCPHGRPIYFILSRAEIERRLKRR